MYNDFDAFLIWMFGLVFGWFCSNYFYDIRCEKKWKKLEDRKKKGE